MLKKILIISLIVCFGGIVVLSFFFLKKQQVKQDFLTIKAVPINSFCVLSINDFHRFVDKTLHNNQIWQGLIPIPAVNKLQSDIRYIDSLAGNDLNTADFLNGKNMLISMHYTGNMDFDYLFSIGLETESNSDRFVEIVSSRMSAKGKLTSYQYDNTTVYCASFDSTNATQRIYYSVIRNMFIVSKARVLVQSSIGQILADESLLKNKSFALVYNSSDREKPMNIFLNYKTIPKFLSFFASNTYYKNISQSTKLANWAELDLTLKNNEILLNGFITTDSLSDNFMHLFSDQEPVSMNIHEVIPSSASIIVSIGVSSSETYKQTYTDCMKKDGSFSQHQKNIDELDSLCNDDVEKTFYEILENEMCLVLTGNTSQTLKDNAYVVMNTKSKRLAEEKLIGMLDSYSQKNGINLKTLKSQIKIDNEISYDIYRLPTSGIPKLIFGGFFSWSDANYFTFIDNYLVMGNSITSLSDYIKSFVLNKTLKTDTKFIRFAENLPDKYNFLVYSKVSNSMDFYKDLLEDSYKKTLETNFDVFSKFQAFAYQLSTSKGKLYNTIYANYNVLSQENSQATWESNLDSSVYSRPTFVLNFQTKEKDIFVQDEKRNVYLLNKTGRVLWKKTITEKITSEIFEVDYFKNGKIQYAFSTENYIYIIDRIGNYVEHYPMQLSSPSSAGLSVFDFDNNKDYRMFIPTKNKKIYQFDITGKVQKDWHFDKSDATITQAIQWYKIKNEDYIVCSDRYSVYFLNKKGDRCISIKEKFEVSRNTRICIDRSDLKVAQAFFLTDKSGQIKRVDFNGNVQTVSIKDFSTDHYFECVDLDNDGINDFIFVDKDELFGFSYNGRKLFSYTFDERINNPIMLFKDASSQIKIGIESVKDNKAYLFKNNGTLVQGFPIVGKTMFSIGRFSSNSNSSYLLIGNADNFIYNYEIK